jgi:hypothetical protein
MRILSFAVILVSASVASTAPLPADRLKEVPPAVERKFIGEWEGKGGCVGVLTLKADGTYERRHYGPGNATLEGTWAVRWNALPPTMILTCTSASADVFVGNKLEVKVIHLDEKVLNFQASDEGITQFKRIKK